jgi:hypothetical protein
VRTCYLPLRINACNHRVNWTRQPEPIVTEGEPGSFDALFTAWPSFLLPLADIDTTDSTGTATAVTTATSDDVSSVAAAVDTTGSTAATTVAADAAVAIDAVHQQAQSILVPNSSGSSSEGSSSISLLYHTLNVEPDKPVYFMIGRAVSDDNGATWRKTGRIPLQNFGADSNRGHGGRCVRSSI